MLSQIFNSDIYLQKEVKQKYLGIKKCDANQKQPGGIKNFDISCGPEVILSKYFNSLNDISLYVFS